MGYRSRSATPGTILCLIATVLLAVVSFNTPLLKSLYFLQATYSSGQYAGTLNLGTLGYCLTENGATTCVGPTVGYEFNPNDLLGVTVFNIPETVTKYLTYTLVLHLVALGFAAAATIFGLLSHISTLSLLCFPTCTASLASTFSLLALVFDLVIFYIAKARIDDVDGASASIGTSVWLVLAAWLLAGLSGCAYGIGRCCVGARRNQTSGDPNNKYSRQESENPDDMRLHALRDEQLRKKEQGLPTFQELERTPLTGADNEDKYLYEEPTDPRTMPGALRRDGSVLQGVGVGYGRRNNGRVAGGAAAAAVAGGAAGYAGANGWNGHNPYAGGYDNLAAAPTRRLSAATEAGEFAGVGAGGAGVEQPLPPLPAVGEYGGPGDYGGQGYYAHEPAQQGYYQNQYQDPYQQQQYQDPYSHSQNLNHQDPYDHYGQSTSSSTPMQVPTPAPTGYGNPLSSDGHGNRYSDVQQRMSQGDPYDGYDDGLGAIGMAATSGAGQHERDYTGSTFGYNPNNPQEGSAQYGNNSVGGAPLHTPTPQHLINPQSNSLLRSPLSPSSEVSNSRNNIVGHSTGGGGGGGGGRGGFDYDEDDEQDPSGGPRPPSYGAVAGFPESSGTGGTNTGYQLPRNEKSGYH